MRTNVLFVLAAVLGMSSCQDKKQGAETSLEQQKAEKPISVQCYRAIYDRDTLLLQVDQMAKGKIAGKMQMKFDQMPVKKGTITGAFSGDTLFVSYTFIEGNNEKVTFKNPMAFLKRDKQLILGNGKMQTTMGATYFVKGEPIDFESVKFKFDSVNCQ